MATIQRKINPYLHVGTLMEEGLGYVGTNLGTLSVDNLISAIGEYINTIEFSTDNRFDANLINTIGLSAIALNSFDESIDMDDFDNDGIYQLLSNDSDSFTKYEGNIETIENRSFQDCENLDIGALQLACIIGKSSANYWKAQIDTPGSSPWQTYLPGSFSSVYSNEAIRGALLFVTKGSGLMGILAAALTFSSYEMVKGSL
jgi:hypothetical protein